MHPCEYPGARDRTITNSLLKGGNQGKGKVAWQRFITVPKEENARLNRSGRYAIGEWDYLK